MAFSVSPSVIVREVDASSTVPAIATPPAAIAGVFRWGPVNETILVSSENELADRFGKPNDSNYETFFVAADFLSYSNALWVVRVDNAAVKAVGSTFDANNEVVDAGAFEALYPGALGNSIDVSFVKSTDFSAEIVEVGQALDSVTRAPIGGAPAVTVEFSIDYNASNTTFEVLENERIAEQVEVGDILVIGNDSVGYQEISITAFAERSLDQFGDETANTALITHYEYKIGFGSPFRLFESEVSQLSFTRKWRHASLVGNKAPSTNNYHILVLDRTGDISGESNTVLESYLDVSTSQTAAFPDGSSNYYVDVIENGSSWVAVANTTAFETATTKLENLVGGTDGTSESALTPSSLAAGYDLFANSNEIDLSFVLQGKGDQAAILANYLISNIAESRKDVVAFLSPSKADVVDENKTNTKLSNVIAYRNKLQNSSYWFMDSGYKYRYDKYNDKYRWVPLNGDMAGLASRVEPFESPAGFRKGVIKNVIKLAFNPNKAQRDQLYSSDVNPVMAQVGQGIVLFGDKTGLGISSAFDRINVRRLFIAVEKAIANAAQTFLFELNDEFTQTQFKNTVEPFLREIQGRRGIIDFRVISDTTVNTPAIIDQGKFRANIFIKPARSINVIELTFVATRSGIEFEEIVGSF
jgi:hypothetical protein